VTVSPVVPALARVRPSAENATGPARMLDRHLADDTVVEWTRSWPVPTDCPARDPVKGTLAAAGTG
jgi:hypothetical protein